MSEKFTKEFIGGTVPTYFSQQEGRMTEHDDFGPISVAGWHQLRNEERVALIDKEIGLCRQGQEKQMSNGYDDREVITPMVPNVYAKGFLLHQLDRMVKELNLCGKRYRQMTDPSLEDLEEIEKALWQVAGRVRSLEIAIFGDMRRMEIEALPTITIEEARRNFAKAVSVEVTIDGESLEGLAKIVQDAAGMSSSEATEMLISKMTVESVDIHDEEVKDGK